MGASRGFVRVSEVGILGDGDAIVHVGEGGDLGIAGFPGFGKVIDVKCIMAEGHQMRHDDAGNWASTMNLIGAPRNSSNKRDELGAAGH